MAGRRDNRAGVGQPRHDRCPSRRDAVRVRLHEQVTRTEDRGRVESRYSPRCDHPTSEGGRGIFQRPNKGVAAGTDADRATPRTLSEHARQDSGEHRRNLGPERAEMADEPVRRGSQELPPVFADVGRTIASRNRRWNRQRDQVLRTATGRIRLEIPAPGICREVDARSGAQQHPRHQSLGDRQRILPKGTPGELEVGFVKHHAHVVSMSTTAREQPTAPRNVCSAKTEPGGNCTGPESSTVHGFASDCPASD